MKYLIIGSIIVVVVTFIITWIICKVAKNNENDEKKFNKN
jgi:heme/copper-type cytochrome/quinol oxidase subunit 2